MGKSFVLSVFKELGANVINSDDIVNIILHDKNMILNIKKILGDKIERENGSLDKEIIAKIIFNNSKLRQKLEALLHPMVFDKIEATAGKFKGKGQLVIVEVPLLFECGYQDRFERTITVYTTQRAAIARLMKKGVSRSNAMERLKAQLPIRVKKKKADYLINNNNSNQDTRKQVKNIYKQLLEIS